MSGYNYQASGYQDLEYQKESQRIAGDIQRITQNVGALQRQLSAGTTEENLHSLLHDTEQLARDTSRRLKDLQSNILPLVSPMEQRHRRLQGERLTNDFTTALNQLQSAQRTLANQDKARIKEARARTGLASGFLDDDKSPGLVDLEANNSAANQGKQKQMKLELQELEERETAMRQLEEDISDVNQIFRDLATMVHDQGEMVDSIESNVENSAFEVAQGTEQLSRARKSANAARKKKICLCGSLAGVLLVLLLIIYWSS